LRFWQRGGFTYKQLIALWFAFVLLSKNLIFSLFIIVFMVILILIKATIWRIIAKYVTRI